MIGTDTDGTMNGFPTENFNRTGGAGVKSAIGKGREPGVSRVINLDRINRYRNSDIKDRSNINKDLRFRDTGSGYKSNKGNHRFSGQRRGKWLHRREVPLKGV
jgi:hypothetical protein